MADKSAEQRRLEEHRAMHEGHAKKAEREGLTKKAEFHREMERAFAEDLAKLKVASKK